MSENQHWVPKFLIRNFADSDGRVFRFDIRDGSITKPPPKRASAAVGFNEFLINGAAISYEDDLEKIETGAAPVLRRIVGAQSVAGLTARDRKRVADFIATQSFRTEAFYKGLELDRREKEFGPTFARLWRSAFLVSREIERRRWVIMTINTDDVFYLGDNPIVLQSTENPSSAGQLGFDIRGWKFSCRSRQNPHSICPANQQVMRLLRATETPLGFVRKFAPRFSRAI